MPVKGSESYVWFTDQKLDTSTDAETYFGRNKVSGMPCVIKVTNEKISQKHLDKFKKINNKNLVKFFGLEFTKHKELVIALEYCDEKCLLKFLEKPENVYGLNDHNLIHLHEDIIGGLEFLNNMGLPKNFYLKPSNILCLKELNGSITFKITDYLYNDYEVQTTLYFINVVYDIANIMVWSIGVLFCHVILGEFPFTAKTQEDARKMVLNKAKDDIFVSDSGNWQSSFPQTVQLTPFLHTKFVAIIKDCMNLKSQIDLKKFFDSKIQSSHPNILVYAFDPSTLQYFACISNFEFDSILKKNSFVVFDNKVINHLSEMSLFEKRISLKEPVIFFNSEMEPNLEELRQVLNEAYSNTKKTLSDDVSHARVYAGFLLFCVRLNERIMLSRKGLKQICNTLLDEVDLSASMVKSKMHLSRLQGKVSHASAVAAFDGLKKTLNGLRTVVVSDQENLEAEAHAASSSQVNPAEPPSESRFHAFFKELSEQSLKTYATFAQDADKQLTHNELQVHKYEKAKLKERTKRAHQLCNNQLNSLMYQFSKYKQIIKDICEIKCLVADQLNKYVDSKSGSGPLVHSHVESGYYSELQISDHKKIISEIDQELEHINVLTREFDDLFGKIT